MCSCSTSVISGVSTSLLRYTYVMLTLPAGNSMLDKSDALPTELWAMVFLHTSSNQWRPKADGLTQEDLEQYSNLHRLKLVCKKFRDTFREHDDLFNVLLLRKNTETQALPGLLAWLHRHHTDISLLQSSCGAPCTDAALAYLTGTDKLLRAHITAPTAAALQILSMCTSLTHCMLLDTTQAQVDLASLKNLPKLVDLRLASAVFLHVPLTSGLTGLTLTDAEVQVDVIDKAVGGLQQLSLIKSEVEGLREGISTFASLSRLCCRRSIVYAFQDANELDTDHRNVNLGVLMSLTCLCSLDLHTGSAPYPSLEPVYALASLRRLKLSGGDIIRLTTSRLCNVSKLVVSGLSPSKNDGVREQAELAVQWFNMPALQSLHVKHVDFSTDDMSVLTSCNNLKVVDFSDSQPVDRTSMKHFAELIYCLGSRRPDVKFRC